MKRAEGPGKCALGGLQEAGFPVQGHTPWTSAELVLWREDSPQVQYGHSGSFLSLGSDLDLCCGLRTVGFV